MKHLELELHIHRESPSCGHLYGIIIDLRIKNAL